MAETNEFGGIGYGGYGAYHRPYVGGRIAGIGAGLENIAKAMFLQHSPDQQDAQQALAEQRRAAADLAAAKIKKYQSDAETSAAARTEAQDPIGMVTRGLFGQQQGPGVASYLNKGGMDAPPVPKDDEGNDFPLVPMQRPSVLTPSRESELRAILASRLLPGKTTYEQATKGAGELQDQDIIRQALNGQLSGQQQSDVAGARSKPVFNETATGARLNQFTGAQDQTSPLAQASIGRTNAQTGQASAAAAKSRSETLPQVQVDVPGGVSVPALGRDAGKAALATVAGGEGGKGFDTLQDPTTGQRWLYNKTTGAAFTMNDDGTKTPVAAANIPKTAQKMGSIGAAGARENVMLGRVGQAGGQVTASLENIARLPLTATSGFFGGRHQGPGLLDATREVLANKVTGQEAQSYNVKAAGIQRNLAAIEAQGLMPPGTLSNQMEAVIWKEGDTNLTKLQKLAETRQIVDAGLGHILENPRVSDPEKAKLRDYQTRMARVVPFNHQDIDDWQAAAERNPGITLGQFMATKKPAAAAPARAAPAAGGVKFLGFE